MDNQIEINKKEINAEKYNRNRKQTGIHMPGKNYNFCESRAGKGSPYGSRGKLKDCKKYEKKANRTNNKVGISKGQVSDPSEIIHNPKYYK